MIIYLAFHLNPSLELRGAFLIYQKLLLDLWQEGLMSNLERLRVCRVSFAMGKILVNWQNWHILLNLLIGVIYIKTDVSRVLFRTIIIRIICYQTLQTILYFFSHKLT